MLSLYFSEITSIILIVKGVRRYILAVKYFCCFKEVELNNLIRYFTNGR